MRGTTRTATEDEDGDNDEMTGGEGVKSLVNRECPQKGISRRRRNRRRGRGPGTRAAGGGGRGGWWRTLCVSEAEVDIPFELVGEVASASAVAKARHVESLPTARHDDDIARVNLSLDFL